MTQRTIQLKILSIAALILACVIPLLNLVYAQSVPNTVKSESRQVIPLFTGLKTNIPIGEVEGVELSINIALLDALGREPRPVLVLIHGGGLIKGDKARFNSRLEKMASKGIVAASVIKNQYNYLKVRGPMKLIVLAGAVIIFLSSQGLAGQNSRVVLASDVRWEALNPARGDDSPQAGTLWGDRKAAVPTGFLAKFADGFSSPPHIHNVTYRAVVISGKIHNDDPEAAPMWMPSGSFWTQPKGEVHITAAKGTHNVALVEIDNGPYLVLPTDQVFDSGERPINIDSSNIVWVDMPVIPVSAKRPKVAHLWSDKKKNQSHGKFIKLAAGFNGKIVTESTDFHAVVIKGEIHYHEKSAKFLEPGSYFGSKGKAEHKISSRETEVSIIYIRSNGGFTMIVDE